MVIKSKIEQKTASIDVLIGAQRRSRCATHAEMERSNWENSIYKSYRNCVFAALGASKLANHTHGNAGLPSQSLAGSQRTFETQFNCNERVSCCELCWNVRLSKKAVLVLENKLMMTFLHNLLLTNEIKKVAEAFLQSWGQSKTYNNSTGVIL